MQVEYRNGAGKFSLKTWRRWTAHRLGMWPIHDAQGWQQFNNQVADTYRTGVSPLAGVTPPQDREPTLAELAEHAKRRVRERLRVLWATKRPFSKKIPTSGSPFSRGFGPGTPFGTPFDPNGEQGGFEEFVGTADSISPDFDVILQMIAAQVNAIDRKLERLIGELAKRGAAEAAEAAEAAQAAQAVDAVKSDVACDECSGPVFGDPRNGWRCLKCRVDTDGKGIPLHRSQYKP